MANSRNVVLARGTVLGATAFALGYVATWIFAGTRSASLSIGGALGGAVPEWRAVLWVFYDSQFVGTGTPRVYGPDGSLWGGGELVSTVAYLGVEYVYAIPVIVLLVAGALAATLDGSSSARDGFMIGMSVTAGYILMVIMGLFPATQSGVAPNPIRAIVVAGIVYPVALGAIGGGITGLFEQWRGDESVESAIHSPPKSRE